MADMNKIKGHPGFIPFWGANPKVEKEKPSLLNAPNIEADLSNKYASEVVDDLYEKFKKEQ